MLRGLLPILLVFLHVFVIGQEMVKRIEISGNKRTPKETILYYFGLRKGFPYDKKAIELGIETLWASGLFSDIKVSMGQGEWGKVIIISVDEQPIIKNIIYKTGSVLREKEIVERLKERDIDLVPYSVYEPHKIQRIKQTIEEMLMEKGFIPGKVKEEVKQAGKFEVEVIFHIQECTRYRIGKIVFEGDPKLNEKILSGAFVHNKEHSLLSWIKGKDIFREVKLSEDLDNLKRKFQEHGYAEASIGKPLIGEFSKRAVFGKEQQMKKIVIPVDAGDIYYLGDLKIKGNEYTPSPRIRQLIMLEKGNIYNSKLINQALEKIREHYQNEGFLFAKVSSSELLDSQNRRADVTFNIREGESVFLRRLEITGNAFTKDKVLRREILMVEQEKFRLDLLSESLQNLTRSEMVRIEEFPEIRVDPEDPTQIDVYLKIVELYKDEWLLTGGYSGYQGAFIGGSFSTVNFFRAGEKLDLMIEYGERSKRYEFGFSEPYLFDMPISFSLRFFNRDIVWPNLFNKIGKGLQLGFDVKVDEYWRAGVGYDFEQVDVVSYGVEEIESLADQNLGSISVFMFRDTVDNPFFPSGGTRLLLSCGFAGSELGSDIQYVKPELEGAFFFPCFRNHVFGLHLEYRSITSLKDSAIPFWKRFYLGGERTLRGYDVYSVGPRNQEGRNTGGEKSFVFNVEYIIPVFESLYAIFFFDAGSAFRSKENIDLAKFSWSSGLEVRLMIPNIQIPIRLIFSYKNHLFEERDSHFSFRLAFGTSF
jgi:outer membrane protein insertion porin family